MNHDPDPMMVKTWQMTQNLAAIFNDFFRSNFRTINPPKKIPPTDEIGTEKLFLFSLPRRRSFRSSRVTQSGKERVTKP